MSARSDRCAGRSCSPTARARRRPAQRRGGFSLIEVTIAMVILGGLLAASVSVVGAIAKIRQSVNEQQMARLLAEDLMAEVLSAAYQDPSGGGTLGADPGELTSDRRTFDDVDDYQNWHSIPSRRDGTALVGGSWTLRVRVDWVQPNAPTTVSGSETGVKRITVEASRSGKRLASLSALRTRAWESAR